MYIGSRSQQSLPYRKNRAQGQNGGRCFAVFAQSEGAGGLRGAVMSLVPKAQLAYIRLVKGWAPKETSAVTMVFEGSRREVAMQRREVCALRHDKVVFWCHRIDRYIEIAAERGGTEVFFCFFFVSWWAN